MISICCFYNQSNCSSELSAKNVPRFVLEQYLESLPCMIKVLTVPFLWMKERRLFLLLTPMVAAVRIMGRGHGRWSRQMMTFKAVWYIWYVARICKHLQLSYSTGAFSATQNWLQFFLNTLSDSDTWILFDLCMTNYDIFICIFSVGYIFLLRTALDVMVSLFFTIFNISHHKCSDLVLIALWNLMILFISS